VKLVVAGSSAAQFLVPPRSRRADGTYGELLPGLLAEQGISAEVQQTGQWYGTIRDLRRDYERAVRSQFPDVLVLNYGMAECQPNIPPLWFVRHVYSWNRSTHPVAQGYRKRLLEPSWRALRHLQPATSSWAPHRISPRRFVAELRQVITMTQDETGALVLLVEVDPPGPNVERWWPGLTERVARYNGLLHELAGENVVVADTARHVTEHGFDQVLPDGLHRNPLGHRLTAEALSKEVQAWLAR
jgi:lysophospholipase L1-like esterase